MAEARGGRLAIYNFVIVCATTFYGTGGGMVESRVNYPSWKFVGQAEWHAYRVAFDERILPVFVFPMFISLVFKVVLLFRRPAGVPAWGPWVILSGQLVTLISTVAFILPHYQSPLEDAPDPALIDGLMFWDTIFRGFPSWISLGVLVYMMVRAMHHTTALEPATPATRPET